LIGAAQTVPAEFEQALERLEELATNRSSSRVIQDFFAGNADRFISKRFSLNRLSNPSCPHRLFKGKYPQ